MNFISYYYIDIKTSAAEAIWVINELNRVQNEVVTS